MASIMAVASKAVYIFLILELTVLVWKTAEFFNKLPEKDKNKPLISCDILMLFLLLLALIIRLILE